VDLRLVPGDQVAVVPDFAGVLNRHAFACSFSAEHLIIERSVSGNRSRDGQIGKAKTSVTLCRAACAYAIEWLSRRDRLAVEEVAQGLGKMMRAAWENGVSREAAGVKNGINDVADELAGVAAFEAYGHGDGGFNRLQAGNFEQDQHMLMLRWRCGVSLFKVVVFEIGVSRRDPDPEALLLEDAMEMLGTATVVACEKNKRDGRCKIMRGIVLYVHGLLAPFLVGRTRRGSKWVNAHRPAMF